MINSHKIILNYHLIIIKIVIKLTMLNFLKNQFYFFLDDKLNFYSLVACIGMFFLSLLNYFSNPCLEWILRSLIYFLGIFLILILKNKGAWITLFLLSYIMFWFSHFRNVTYFTVIVFLISFYDFLRYPMLILYAINVFLICHFHNLQIIQIVYHLGLCTFIYFSENEIIKRVKNLINKKLNLTADEKIILDYLAKGIQQNDIVEFTAQTVSRKLRQAKIRNGISTTKGLLEKYKKENNL